MLPFRLEQHIERWCRQWQRPLGGTLSLAQGWHLAQLWYGNRLDPQWRPMNAAEAESVFRQVGLVGKFRKLTGWTSGGFRAASHP